MTRSARPITVRTMALIKTDQNIGREPGKPPHCMRGTRVCEAQVNSPHAVRGLFGNGEAILCAFATIIFALSASSPLTAGDVPPREILIEAEAFDDYGGWVLDQQFMDQMGSPFLLAHGLGVPVKDATTTVDAPLPHVCHVFVRTRDWTAPWKAKGSPGRFQVLIDGKPLAATFGTEGAQWHWQSGGTVELTHRRIKLALHDLTGFEGRCDAIVIGDSATPPPDDGPELAAYRHRVGGISEKPADGGKYDLVVVGGGIAGMCTAMSAARLGATVALIQDRPVLGGNNSSEVRVWLNGDTNFKPYPHVGDLVREFEQRRRQEIGPAKNYDDQARIATFKAEKNIRLMLNERVNQVERARGRIVAVVSQNTRTARRTRVAGRWFADCTGDADVGFLAGADFDMTEKGHQGGSNLWTTEETGKPSPFPRCPWACDLGQRPFPSYPDQWGKWFWESGFDRHPIDEMERMRDNNLRAMYGAWDALKNVRKLYPNRRLSWAAYVLGKRESRRLLGDVVLTRDDLLAGKSYPDGCVPTSWSIDVHLADPKYAKGFEEDPFISCVASHYEKYKRPYWVPYRCLYSRNVPNLFMAGRDISVTHEALGTTRVQRTTGMMGEVIGMAVSLCKKHGADPRGVYAEHLDELKELMARGVGKQDSPNESR